jgi:hypothetical protein
VQWQRRTFGTELLHELHARVGQLPGKRMLRGLVVLQRDLSLPFAAFELQRQWGE